jgi:hypothetical protein
MLLAKFFKVHPGYLAVGLTLNDFQINTAGNEGEV